MFSWIKSYLTQIAGKFIIKPYFKLRTKKSVWLFLNREARRLFAQNLPALNETQKQIIQKVFLGGIAQTNLEELFPNENKLLELQKYTNELKAKNLGQKTSKTFLTYLLPPYPMLDFENIIIKMALDERVLGIVNSYFEMFGKFYYFTLNITHPMPMGATAEQSQRWHRDPEDIKMLKMFVYLNDVDEETGPFIYISKSNLGNKWNKIFPQRPPIGYYPPNGELEKIIPETEIKKCLGKAGSVIFADTAGLHKGGFATQNERLMLTVGYAPSSSPNAKQYIYPQDIEKKMATLSPSQKYAVVLNPSKLNSYIMKKFRKFFKST